MAHLPGGPRERALVRRMREPQALYTVPELARLVGITRQRMGAMLDAHGCRYVMSGRYRYVSLVALRECMPDVWDSALLVLAMRGHDVP
jgi:hypothetical protein